MKARWIIVCLAWSLAGACYAAPNSSKDENIAKDGGFEEAGAVDKPLLNWDTYSSKDLDVKLVDTSPRTGAKCLRMWTQGKKNANEGVSQTLAVQPKGKYTFRVFALNDKADKLGGDAVGNIGIEWYDAEGTEISRVASKEWDAKLSKMHWEEYVVESKAPPYAAKVKFMIYLREGDKGGKGGVLLDDAEITVK